MSDTDPQNFSWRDYIELSDRFTPQERGQVEQTLDATASGSDNEGKQLIRAAYQNNGAEYPIEIAPVKNGEGSFASAGTIGIDFDQVGKLTVQEDGVARPVSLNGILTHELYHTTQPENTLKHLREVTDKYVDRANLANSDMQRNNPNIDVDSRVREQAQALTERIADYQINSKLRGNEDAGLSLASEGLVYYAMPDLTRNIQDELAKGMAHKGQREEDATRYADAAMGKNYGDAEPQRGKYSNGAYSEHAHDPIIHEKPEREYPSDGFLGATSPVGITPSDGINNIAAPVDPMADLLKQSGACFKSAGIGGDGAHYCNGDSGSLPPPSVENVTPQQTASAQR